MDWTDKQREAIEFDKSTLVSASAGSGKTTIIIERVLRLIDSCDIDRILILTFNEAIASEMKIKLYEKLFLKIKTAEGERRGRLIRQLDRLDFADICTFHGFCMRIIKANFEAADIDPNVTVMDKREADSCFADALEDTLGEYLDKEDLEFAALTDMFGRAGKDESLIKTVTELYTYANIEPEPEAFLDELLLRQSTGQADERAKDIITEYYRSIFEGYKDSLYLVRKDLDRQLKKTADSLMAAEDICGCLSGAKDFEALIRIAENVEIPPSKNDKNTPEDVKEVLKGLKEKIREHVKAVLSLSQSPSKEESTAAYQLTAKLVEIVKRLMENYAALKEKEGKLDFSDLEHKAVLLLKNLDRAMAIRDNYVYVFVDEYQDTNPTQEYILNKISGENSLFAVGDIKQSIYGFRLCMPDILLERYKRYGQDRVNKKAIDLSVNFRSERGILDFVNGIFGPIMTEKSAMVDYKNTSMLTTRKKDDEGRVEAKLFYDEGGGVAARPEGVYSVKFHAEEESAENLSAINQADYIADTLQEIIGKYRIKDQDAYRPLKYGDVALLFRKRGNADAVIKRLSERGVPLNTSGFTAEKYFTERDTLINLLRVINNGRQDIPLTGYLLSYFGGLTEAELAEVKLSVSTEHFYEAVRAAAKAESTTGKKVKAALDRLDGLKSLSYFKDVFSLLNDLVTQSGYDAFVLKEPDGKNRYAALRAFLHGINGSKHGVSLQRFLKYISGAAEDTEETPADETDSVTVSTIHGSKGLEYPVVFMAELDSEFNIKSGAKDVNSDKEAGIGVMHYDPAARIKRRSLVNQAIIFKEKTRSIQEEMRILYVALTRAKNMLFLTGSVKSGFGLSPKPLSETYSAAGFVWDAYYKNPDIRSKITIAPLRHPAYTEDNRPAVVFNKPRAPYFNIINNIINYKYPYQAATETEQKYSVSELSAENINGDSLVPNRFKEEKRLTGIIYHKVMENIDFLLPDIVAVKTALAEMEEGGILTAAETRAVDAEAVWKCLCHPVMREAAGKTCYREMPFMLRVPASEMGGDGADSVLIQGTVDLLVTGEKNILIDYKTSSKRGVALTAAYGRQLELYANAVEASFGIKVHKKGMYSFVTGEMYFI